MVKSWKTTLAGVGSILLAVGSILQAHFDSDPNTVPNFELAFAAIMAGLVGIFSRDNDKSSEDAGVK